MELNKLEWAGSVVGVVAIMASIGLLRGSQFLMFGIVVGVVIASLPFLVSFLDSQKKKKEKESKFLEFTRDLVENVKTGTPISKAVMNLKKRDYGELSVHITKLANQLSIGLTLRKSLINFSKDVNSRVVSRAVGLISEAERAGGDIETILVSVAESINQIEILRKERKASISNLVTQGYIIFMVFIIIMLVMEFRILPMVSDLDSGGGGLGLPGGVGGGGGGEDQDFSAPLFILLLVQSFFAGLVIGKISEGSIKDGIKHSFILIALTLLIVSGARGIFGAA
jgi:flagellar protein FlaJ